MILMTYSYGKLGVAILFVTLSLLLIYIAYRKLLVHMGKGEPVKEDYCVLYSQEDSEVSGEIEVYFTTETPKEVTIELLDADLKLIQTICSEQFSSGGHIVRFDSSHLSDGIYFYSLRTDNQKTMKKMLVRKAA
jgi:hypothetical protein